MRRSFIKHDAEGYFEELRQSTKDLVRDLLVETMDDNIEGWGDSVEEIECKSRDGFIPYSSNKGGLMVRRFTSLRDLWGSGHQVSHEGAQAEIERQIEYGLQCMSESIFEQFEDLLKAKGITKEQCSYHSMHDLAEVDPDLSVVVRTIEDAEIDALSGDENSIMFEVRFMYHGKQDGKHSASISCAVNTEGPYHRSSISWAPSVFCEGAKEIEIEWTSLKDLKRLLTKALKDTSEAIF